MLSRGDGGLEKHVVEMANTLLKTCRVSVLADPRYRERLDPAITFVALDARKGRLSFILASQLKRILVDLKPDIIHAHAGKAASIMALLKPFYKESKWVVTRHNTTNPSAFYLRRFDACIAVSHKVAESEPDINWHVVENGTQPLQPSEPLIPLQQPAIVTIGRLVKIKGLDFVLDAWKNLNAHLYIIGDGPERAALEQQVQNEGLKNIHFVGYTEQVADYLCQAKLMLMPSFKEGAPYAMVEALLASVPVVATDVGNAKALLPNHAIIEKGSAEAIANSVKQLLQNPEDFQESFADSFSYARENLSLDKMVENTIGVYKSLLQEPNP